MPEQSQLTCRSCETITPHVGPSTQTTPDCTGRRLITIATYACARCGSMYGYRVRPTEMAQTGAGQHQT